MPNPDLQPQPRRAKAAPKRDWGPFALNHEKSQMQTGGVADDGSDVKTTLGISSQNHPEWSLLTDC